MRGVLAGHDQGGNVEPEQVLRFRPGDRVPVEQRPRHARDQDLVPLLVLTAERVRERRVAPDDADPGTDPGVLGEPAVGGEREVGHRRHGPFGEIGQVPREPGVLRDPVPSTSRGRVQHHGGGRFRPGGRENGGHRAPDAAAHQVGAGDAEMVEQPLALGRVVRPGDPLDAAAGRARLAPVEQHARVGLGQLVHQPQPRVDAKRRPVGQRRAEPARGEQQQRRAVAPDLVARGDAVDNGGRHGVPPA